MKVARRSALAACAVALVSCSPPLNDHAPDLSPQFGTLAYDSVEHLAYSRGGTLYAAGFWGSGRNTFSAPRTKGEAFLRRYNSSGHLIWESFFDLDPSYTYGGRGVRVVDMAVDGRANVYVGWTEEYQVGEGNWVALSRFGTFTPDGSLRYRRSLHVDQAVVDPSGNAYVHSGDRLLKLSPSGVTLWSKREFGGSNFVYDLVLASDGSLYTLNYEGVVGRYRGDSGARVWQRKLLRGFADVAPPPNGNCQAGCADNVAYRLQPGLSGELHVVGGPTYLAFDPDAEGGIRFTHDLSFFRFSDDGNKLNQAFLFTADRERCGDYFCPPYTWPDYEAATGRDGNTYVTTALDGDAFITKVNRQGVRVWSKRFGTPEFDVPIDVATYSGNEVYLGGVTDGSLVHRQLGGGDAFVRKLSGNGTVVWTR